MEKSIFRYRVMVAFVACLLSGVCIAAPRGKAAMQAIASAKMQSLRQTAMSQNMSQTMQARPVMRAAATSRQIVSATAEADDYVVYVPEQGKGFVIVSTDDRQPEVLAFSDSETFDATSMPDGLKAMLEAYTILANGNDPDALNRIATAYSTVKNVEPLLKDIAFDQVAPYNKKAPVINNKASYAGCVATSMAQIMAYYRHPAKATGGTVSYTTTTHQVPVTWNMDATTFDWNNILPTYTIECTKYTGSETTSATALAKYSTIGWDDGNNLYLAVTRFANAVSETLSASVQLILTDNTGKMVTPVGEACDIQMPANSFYNNFYLSITVPADIADGDYKLYIGVKKNGTSVWNLSAKQSDSSTVDGGLAVKKQGNKFCLDGKWVSCGYTAAQGDAVATLLAAAGAAAKMDYSPVNSLATYVEMMKGMNAYFGYDDGMVVLPAANATAEDMNGFISDELSKGAPLSCLGVNEDSYGHSYMIDGCKVEDGKFYVHINWGYSGVANGYFLLANMDPSINSQLQSYNYSYRYSMIKGFKPDDGVAVDSQFSLDKLTADKSSYAAGEDITVTYNNVINRSLPTFTGHIYLVSIDTATGEEAIVAYLFSIKDCKLGYGVGQGTKTKTISATMPAGTYRLALYTVPDDGRELTPTFCVDMPTVTIISSTGISDLPADENLGDEAVKTYNAAGQMVNPDAKGIVIKRSNGAAVKRVMR